MFSPCSGFQGILVNFGHVFFLKGGYRKRFQRVCIFGLLFKGSIFFMVLINIFNNTVTPKIYIYIYRQ